MKTTLLILASVMLILGAVVVYAAEQTVTASVTVPGAISITAEPIAFSNTAAGSSDTKNLAFSVTSNKAFTVTTKANAANFTGGPTPFSISNLVFGAGNTAYTVNAQTIATGSASVNAQNFSVSHTLSIPGSTLAGDYSVGIVLTATQN